MTQELDNLASLAAEADALGAPAPGAPGAADLAAPSTEPSLDEQAQDMANLVADLIVEYAPAAADVWTPKARLMSAAVIAPLAEKYGWSMKAIPPELAAAMVLGPLLYKSAVVVAEKIKVDRAAKAVPAQRVTSDTAASPVAHQVGEEGKAPPTLVHPQMALYAA